MQSNRTYFLILGLLYGLTILHAAWFFPLLPDMIGNKYGFDGSVTRLDSKEIVIGLYMFVSLTPLLLFFILSRVSLKNSNFPNKEYWLREENAGKLRKIFSRIMFRFSVVLMLFWISMFHQIFQAGMNQNQMNNMPLYITFALFAVFMVYWIISLFREFRIPENGKDQDNGNNAL